MKTLVLQFWNPNARKKKTIRIKDVKDNLTDQQIQDLMNAMVGVVLNSDFQPDEARVIDSNVQLDLIPEV